MAIRPQTAIDRINAANDQAYNATTNPGGLARNGHRVNFVADLGATVAVADYTLALMIETETFAGALQADADRFEAAVAAIEAGPVTSVNGMSGAVVIDTSQLEADVAAAIAAIPSIYDFNLMYGS